MSQILHYIDFLDGFGYIQVKPPVEWKGLEIELTFADDSEKQRLSVTDFTWAGDVAEKINAYVDAGLTGGNGIFEALPYKAVLICDNTSYEIVTAGLQVSSKNAKFFCDIVKTPLRETGKIDFLTARADSFRFELLANSTGPGSITSADYIDIYYMVGKYPQGVEIMISALTLFMMVKEAYESVKRIGDAIAAVSGGATGFLEGALQIALLLAYLILLLIAIYDLVQKLISLIFPFVYFHRAMYARTLWQKACAYLGLGFNSSIFTSSSAYYNEYIMPPKNVEGKKIGNISAETGYYDGTFGDFIRSQVEQFNGEIKIIGNTLHFERKGSFTSLSTYVVPEVDYEFKGTNADDVAANYLIEYLYDSIDLNDFNAPLGRIVEVSVEPIVVTNKQNITLDGLVKRSIPYTLPNVKTSQSELEFEMTLVFNGFAFLINSIASIFSSSSTPIPYIPFGANINVIQTDTHFTSFHKCGIYSGAGHTSALSSTTLGSRELFKKFHYTQIVKPVYSNANGNQWWQYEGYEVGMCCEEYLQIKDNNYGTYQGDNVHLLSVKWRAYDLKASIDFEVNRKYTNNLQAKLMELGQPVEIL